MSNFNDESLYSKGLEQFRKNQLDNSLNFLLSIKKKNLNTLKLISQIHIKKNDFENAKISLYDNVVRSPVIWTIISRPVEVGKVISSPTSAVGGGTLLMTMADLSKVRVRALVDEIDVRKVSVGQTVSIKVAAYRDKEFIGTVSKIEPKAFVQQNVTTFPVLIDITFSFLNASIVFFFRFFITRIYFNPIRFLRHIYILYYIFFTI